MEVYGMMNETRKNHAGGGGGPRLTLKSSYLEGFFSDNPGRPLGDAVRRMRRHRPDGRRCRCGF